MHSAYRRARCEYPNVRARPDPRSESGAVNPSLIIWVALVALGAWILLAAFEADTAHYGEVPVPSEGLPVDLPEGEIDVYYAEKIDPDAPEGLTLPDGLQFSIVDAEGVGVRSDSRGGDPEETDNGMTRVVGAAFVPAEGRYFVNADSAGVEGRVKPELTFGQSPLQAIGDRFEEVVDELKGPTGIIVAIAIVVLLLLPAVKRQLNQR